MKRQLQFTLFAILMVLAGLSAYGQFSVGNIEYTPTSTSATEVEITGYTGTGGHVEIPPTVTDNSTNTTYAVTAIGNEVFMRKHLTSVTIPEGVTHIGDKAFADNRINSLVIPTTVTSIGETVFWNNRIGSLEIPEGITDIRKNTFGRNNLASMTIPASVTSIGGSAFITHPDSPTKMTEITMLGSTAPVLPSGNPFTDRGDITLIVPAGSRDDYRAKGWTGFGLFDLGDFRYEITATSPQPEVTASRYIGTETVVDIPETIDHEGAGYKVTAIGDNFFDAEHKEEEERLTSVTIPDGVTSIGEDAFHYNRLTSIVIPESVTSIGQRAFGTNRLDSVAIPDGITRIEQWVFAQNDLKELTIPINVEFIGYQAFYENNNLSVVKVERNPPIVPDSTAFDNKYGQKIKFDLVVPFEAVQNYQKESSGWTGHGFIAAGITTIDVGGAAGKVKYGIVDVPNEATLIGRVRAFHNLVIPPQVDIDGNTYPVTAIGEGAFRNLDAFLTLHIPSSVRSIGSQAFYGTSLNYVVMEGEDPPTLAEDAFEYPQRSERVNVVVEGPQKWANAYINAGWTGFKSLEPLIGQIHRSRGFDWRVTSLSPDEMELDWYWGDVVGHLEIPKEIPYSRTPQSKTYTITGIDDYAFHHRRESLDSFDIPDSVRWIGEGAFSGVGLTDIDLPDGLTAIGEDAFWQNQLTSVEIPESVTSLGQRAFGHNDLTEVTIPDGVTRIEQWVFAQNKLTNVIIPSNVEHIGYQAFYGNQLTEVTLPGNLKSIDLFAFQRNPDLRLVTVEANDPPRLNEHAFSNADRDQIDLVVPFGKLQEYLDNGWHGFRSISYGIFTVDGITYGITSQTNVMVVDYTGTATAVEIPGTVDDNGETYTVTAIGEGAFSDNQLTAVTIPSSVGRIGGLAFYNNPDLALVRIEASDPPMIDATAFTNPNRHEIYLVVPEGSVQAYEDNGWGGFRSISEDSTPPRPTIDAPQSIDGLEPFTVSITFDVEVTDFGVDDIQVTNATVSDLTGSGSTYTATISPTSPCGITIDVPANVATGVNGVANPAAEQVSLGAVDTIAPTITCPADVVANTADNGTDNCTTTVALGSPVADDNCSVATVVAQINGVDIDPDTYAFGGGTTIVTWIVSDATGNTASCEQTVTVEVARDCRSGLLVDFNRGFSPNGDGIADTLVIEGLERYRNNVVRIYDLSQQLLFSAHYGGPGDGWDGTKEGRMVPVGPYVCVIDYNEPGLGHETKMIYVNY